VTLGPKWEPWLDRFWGHALERFELQAKKQTKRKEETKK
jgi:hypothetical protein